MLNTWAGVSIATAYVLVNLATFVPGLIHRRREMAKLTRPLAEPSKFQPRQYFTLDSLLLRSAPDSPQLKDNRSEYRRKARMSRRHSGHYGGAGGPGAAGPFTRAGAQAKELRLRAVDGGAAAI